MRTIPVMEVRRHLGSLLDEVRLKSETFVLERAGKAIAMLTPVVHEETPSAATSRRLRAVRELTGIHPDSERTPDIDAWLQRERGSWE